MMQSQIPSPIGGVRVSVDPDGAVVAVSFSDGEPVSREACAAAVEAARQLEEYFAGSRRSFELPLAFAGTDFERRVWAELVRIPYGATETYGAIAQRLGDAGAGRAVGLANARNPIAIVVPCHRVVGAEGGLTGYAGGLWRKRWLLAHEAGQSGLPFGDTQTITR